MKKDKPLIEGEKAPIEGKKKEKVTKEHKKSHKKQEEETKKDDKKKVGDKVAVFSAAPTQVSSFLKLFRERFGPLKP